MKNSDIENDNEIQDDNANKESVVDKIKSEASGVTNVVKEKVSKVYSKCANTPQRVILSIVVLAAAVGCIVATIAYRAWLGGIFYIGAAILADYVIRANDKDEEGKIRPNFIIEYCQNKEFNPPQYILKAFRDGDIWDKISSGVVVLFPIVIAVIVFLWIYVDTSRNYADAMKRIDERYKKEMYRIDREYEEEMKRIGNEYGFDY